MLFLIDIFSQLLYYIKRLLHEYTFCEGVICGAAVIVSTQWFVETWYYLKK